MVFQSRDLEEVEGERGGEQVIMNLNLSGY